MRLMTIAGKKCRRSGLVRSIEKTRGCFGAEEVGYSFLI